ncbi:hypothetical protein AU197_25775 [Mycobacterium sp. IS-1590]|uniref:hypothetical protein n=1 Tax=Mycobacterium sp. IS-1590 TaxID=1772286 RepID=UPI00074AA6A2|nr:hypothetical protein [Mycobacterium sp. IS-1590]KUI41652.1 hypothetical protein AU197_25775 [Mycobacterium sp. IS-1590]
MGEPRDQRHPHPCVRPHRPRADGRRAAIAKTYSPEVRWPDDDGVSVGHDALDAEAQARQNGQLAGLSFLAEDRITDLFTVITAARQ